jgi:uncharacterized protein (DUF2147 family)
MSSQGTDGGNVDGNHFMGELERTGNIAGLDNVKKAVARFVGSFIFKKVKFVDKNDAKMAEQKDEEEPQLQCWRMARDLDFHCHANYNPSGVEKKKWCNTKCEEGVDQW